MVYQPRFYTNKISIHAPHAGSDSVLGVPPGFVQISIHAPHAGSDGVDPSAAQGKDDFNPRSPCGERRPESSWSKNARDFNPRSPCGERLAEEGFNFTAVKFQSTLPMRGATGSVYRL